MKDISFDCDMLADDTTLHTSGKALCKSEAIRKTAYIRYPIGVIIIIWSPICIKIKFMTIATRQKHQLSPLPLDLVINGAKIDQVSEHRLLGITIDNKFRWDSHINNVCKKKNQDESSFYRN